MAVFTLDRLVRLLESATRGGPLSIVFKMLANLVPHYLGIAVPAALFVGVLYTIMRLSSDSELDVMRASGLSLRRLSMPILAFSVAVAIISSYIIGFLDPHTRFAFRALQHILTKTAWDSAIERGAFFTGFGGKTILIGNISEGGNSLSQIFVKEIDQHGQDIVTTAESGQLEKSPDLSLVLTLRNGVRTETTLGTSQVKAVVFTKLELPMSNVAPEPFRNRGERVRELTLFELVEVYFNTPEKLHIEDIKAELNSRLIEIIWLPILPILAIPIGISSRRASKGIHTLVGILFLVGYYEIYQFGYDIVSSGMLGPFIALWIPFIAFSGVSIWLFHLANSRPGADPLAHVFESITDGPVWIRKQILRLKTRCSHEATE